jgi:hypothetical protein
MKYLRVKMPDDFPVEKFEEEAEWRVPKMGDTVADKDQDRVALINWVGTCTLCLTPKEPPKPVLRAFKGPHEVPKGTLWIRGPLAGEDVRRHVDIEADAFKFAGFAGEIVFVKYPEAVKKGFLIAGIDEDFKPAGIEE